MAPMKRVSNQRDAVAQKGDFDFVVKESLELSTPTHKRDPAPKSALHLEEKWEEIPPSAHGQVARIAAFAAARDPSTTLAIEGSHLSENSPSTRALPRQYAETSTIPAYYGALYSSPSPGAVVGITLGAVAGFILILFLIYTCINLGGYSAAISESGGTASVVTRRSRHHYRSSQHSEAGGGVRGGMYKHRRSSRRRSRSTSSAGDGGETVEIRRTKTSRTDRRGRSGDAHRHGHGDGIILEERHQSRPMGQGHGHGQAVAERIVVEERRRGRRRQSRTARSRSPPERGPIVVESSEPSHPHERERIVVEEDVSSVSSPPGPPRRRRSSGYRDIRPGEFAGGDEPLREIRRSRSIGRHGE